MNRILFYVLLSFMVTVFIGCSSSNGKEIEEDNLSEHHEGLTIISEIKEGDFIYRLVTEKEKYYKGEPIKVYAELEYIGDEEEVTINHAVSPFNFPITEKTRNYQLGYGMNLPGLRTTLKKGEPLHEEYNPGGGTGYGETDEEGYVNFIKELWANGFPIGIYEVNGYADFSITKDNGTEENFNIKGQVEFEILENK